MICTVCSYDGTLQVKLNESMRTGIILSGTDTWVGK